MLNKISDRMLAFALTRPYLCLSLSVVFSLLCSAKATEYAFYGRLMLPLLTSIVSALVAFLLFYYFYARNNLLMYKVMNYLSEHRYSVVDKDDVVFLRALAKRQGVSSEFNDYLSQQNQTIRIVTCVEKIKELMIKKLDELST